MTKGWVDPAAENFRTVRRYRRGGSTHAAVATAMHLCGVRVFRFKPDQQGWTHYQIQFPHGTVDPPRTTSHEFVNALWDELEAHTYETAWELFHAVWAVFRKLPSRDRMLILAGRE